MVTPQKANIVHFADPEDDMEAICGHAAPAFLIEPGDEEARVKALAVYALCTACRVLDAAHPLRKSCPE
jgi:hypothetical protein